MPRCLYVACFIFISNIYTELNILTEIDKQKITFRERQTDILKDRERERLARIRQLCPPSPPPKTVEDRGQEKETKGEKDRDNGRKRQRQREK